MLRQTLWTEPSKNHLKKSSKDLTPQQIKRLTFQQNTKKNSILLKIKAGLEQNPKQLNVEQQKSETTKNIKEFFKQNYFQSRTREINQRRELNLNSNEDLRLLKYILDKNPDDRTNKQLQILQSTFCENSALKKLLNSQKGYDEELEIYRQLQYKQYEKNSTIFRMGDDSDSFYLIVKGEVMVLLPVVSKKSDRCTYNQIYQNYNKYLEEKKKLPISFEKFNVKLLKQLKPEKYLQIVHPQMKNIVTLRQGQQFGELALFDNSQRTASIFAPTELLCVTLSKFAFKEHASHTSQQDKNLFLKTFPNMEN